ncbi:MAG: hypothetical protein ACP5T0_04570 [Verrucomicrobiia bacterium]
MPPDLLFSSMGKELISKGAIVIIAACAIFNLSAQQPINKNSANSLDVYTNLNQLLERELEKLIKPSPWQASATITSAAGYRDNITLSHYQIENSPFIENSLELSLYRVAVNSPQLVFYATGDDLRYLKQTSVDKEQTFFGMAQIKQKYSTGLQPGLTAQYIYQDRVIDLSGDPLTISSLHVVGHTFITKPSLRYDFSYTDGRNQKRWLWAEMEFPISRQDYDSPLDDYWEFGPKLTFGLNYKPKPKQKSYSDVSLSLEYTKRAYDNMMETDYSGARLPGTHLEYNQFKLYLSWHHYLDEKCYWRLYSKFGYLRNMDSGVGYYDYDRYTLSEQLRYRDKYWEARIELKVSLYDYDKQPVSYTSGSLRRISNTTLNLHIERQIIKKVKVFSEFEHENNNSTLTAEAYQVNTINGGLMIEF